MYKTVVKCDSELERDRDVERSICRERERDVGYGCCDDSLLMTETQSVYGGSSFRHFDML